jgi:hypothetical protein
LDQITNDLNQAGAVVGLLSLFCSTLRPLRPVSALGVQVLSHPGVALTLLFSGGYSLYRQSPEIWSAAGRLTSSYPANSPHSQVEDLVMISGYGIGLLGFSVGVNSFAMGGRTYFSSLRQLEAEGVPSLLARQISWRKADAVRRAAQDPEIWNHLARSSVTLSETERLWLARLSQFSNHALLEGSAVVGVAQLGVGLEKMAKKARMGENVSAKEVFSLLLNTATQVAPGVTMALYRAGRGNRDFNLGPALSQELTEATYRDPKMAGWVLEKLERGIPRLSAVQEKEYVAQGHQDLNRVEKMLENAALLDRPILQRSSESSPLTSPVPEKIKPTAGDSQPNSLKKEWIDFGVQDFLTLYSQGGLKPTSILKIILEHPSAKNGAIFPRSIDRGALGRKIRRLAEESDRRFENGNPRPLEGIFVAVKDLFTGIDGVMNLGSKTARVKGVGKSPVVEALLEMGAIPIPVGMVAAANGGSGLHAGFGYIPHPSRNGYDPAGSSSATAHVVGLKDLPINLGIGTDTGGSIIAPAGAVDLFGFVPPL